MIKIDLITGFLGAGKTTFLLQYASFLMRQGLRIGILEYDYGAVNVDMLLLKELRGPQCEIEMLAAACDADCLKRRFRTKLISMAMSGYDRVLVEPSGIFDMDEFFDALADSPLDRWYEAGSVITVVNALQEETLDPGERFLLASQTAAAGVILLSRTQLAGEKECERTLQYLRAAAEQIRLRKDYERVSLLKPWSEFTDEDFARIRDAGYELCDYVKLTGGEDETEFTSLYYLDTPITLEALERKTEKLFACPEYGEVHRVKGCVQCGEGSVLYNATRTDRNLTPVKSGKATLLVIGKRLDEDAINTLMNA